MGSIIHLRALQGHSGDSIIDLAMQDHVLISLGVCSYIHHEGSNFNIPSILSNGLMLGGPELSRRQSVFFLLVDPRDENHRDPENIDYSVPRRAQYKQNKWKRHQDTVFWTDIDLGIIKERLKFHQTRSNAIILQGVLPPSCIVRAERLKGGEPLCKRQYLPPHPPPKISWRHDLNWTRGNDDLGSWRKDCMEENQEMTGAKLMSVSRGNCNLSSIEKPTVMITNCPATAFTLRESKICMRIFHAECSCSTSGTDSTSTFWPVWT